MSRRIDYKDTKPNNQQQTFVLSSSPPICSVITRSSCRSSPELLTDIRNAYTSDELCSSILYHGSAADRRDYIVRDGLIYKDGKIYIPNNNDIKTRILHESHDTSISGHIGTAKTNEIISRQFYWPRMSIDVSTYVTSCVACQQNKSSQQAKMGLLLPLPIPDRRWDVVTMDLITALPKTRSGNDAIVVFVDKLTKMVHYAATTTNINAASLAQLFYHEIVRHHGVPRELISDRDPRFTSSFWQTLWGMMGTKITMSTAYHPQTDGQTERANRTLEDMVRAYVNYQQDDWDNHLVSAEFAYNNSVQASTGFSPFYLNSGQHPNLPLTLMKNNVDHTSNETVQTMVKRMIDNVETTTNNLRRAQQQQSIYTNQHRRDHVFSVGDRVLLSTTNLRYDTGRAPKLIAKYIGPFTVKRVINNNAYELDLPSTLHIHPVINISQLKTYRDGVTMFPSRDQPIDRPLPTIIATGEEAWEVESIVKKRVRRYGRGVRTEYLIKWKGYNSLTL